MSIPINSITPKFAERRLSMQVIRQIGAFTSIVVMTTTEQGWYRFTGNLYATTLSSTAASYEVFISGKNQIGEASGLPNPVLVNANVSTAGGEAAQLSNVYMLYMDAGQTIQIGTSLSQGSDSGAVYSFGVVIEKL